MPTPCGTPLTRCVVVGDPPVEPPPVKVPVVVPPLPLTCPPGATAPGVVPGSAPPGPTVLPLDGTPSPWFCPAALLPSPCTVDPQPASKMAAAVAAIGARKRRDVMSGSDRVRRSGGQPAAEVDSGDATALVAGEVAAHSLRRPVRDDVRVAVAGDNGQRVHRLLLRNFLALLTQRGGHLGLDSDLRGETAALDSDVDRGCDGLERPGELGELFFTEGQLLGLHVDDAEEVLERPLLQLLVDLMAVGPAVGHRDVGEAPLGHQREVGVLAVRGSTVTDEPHARDVLDEPADADEVTQGAALHGCGRLLHQLEQLMRQQPRAVGCGAVTEVELRPRDLVPGVGGHPTGGRIAARQRPRPGG